MAQLLFCETVTALALLRQKGSFILKTFTTLEHHTVCLLYIINCCFSEVHNIHTHYDNNIEKLRSLFFGSEIYLDGGKHRDFLPLRLIEFSRSVYKNLKQF